KDDIQAVNWYCKAAAAGDANGMSNLGVMYRDGRGVVQDDSQAVYWFRKAADAGYAPAMRHLGWMFEHGRGIPNKDDVRKLVYDSLAPNATCPAFNTSIIRSASNTE